MSKDLLSLNTKGQYDLTENDFDKERNNRFQKVLKYFQGLVFLVEDRTPSKMDRQGKLEFLMGVASTGEIGTTCCCLNISQQCLHNVKKRDPVFREAVRMAVTVFRDNIRQAMFDRGVRGYTEPVIGGKDRDEVLFYKRIFSDAQLTNLARIHIPEMRKQEILHDGEININTSFDFSKCDSEDLLAIEKLLDKQIANQPKEESLLIEGEIIEEAD